MTETERLGPLLTPSDIAACIAQDAQENHAGLDVITVSPAFTDEVGGELYRQLYVILPSRAGDDFLGHRITLAHVQDLLLAELNRTDRFSSACRFSAVSWRSPNSARKNGRVRSWSVT